MVPKLEKEHRLKYHLHLQNFFSTKIDNSNSNSSASSPSAGI
jgi:hypothetical protein